VGKSSNIEFFTRTSGVLFKSTAHSMTEKSCSLTKLL